MGDLYQSIVTEFKSLYSNPAYQFEVHFLIGLALCIISGFIIGSEREKSGKPAGISTHTLVLMGSMLFTMLSGLDEHTPSRIAANIVTGIGFLGGGIILKSGDQKVANLTTAAGIWVSAAVGMALGFKLYFVALVTVTVASIGLHFIPHPKHKKLKEKKLDSQSGNEE